MPDLRTKTEQPYALESEAMPAIDRRSMLTNLFRGTYATGLAVTFSPLPIITGGALYNAAFRSEQRKEEINQPSDFQLTCPAAQELQFRSLGITHIKERLEIDTEKIDQAIKESSILILEGPVTAGYFAEIAKRAKNIKQLTIYALEYGATTPWDILKQAAPTTAPILLGAWSLSQLFQKENKREILRTIAASIAAIGQVTIGISPIISWQEASGKLDYTPLDVSWTGDGRTVIFLKNILSICRTNPGQNILAITGKAHSLGFQHYFSDQQRYQDFEKISRIYHSLYERYLGYQAEEVT